jgi:hypothetical protein
MTIAPPARAHTRMGGTVNPVTTRHHPPPMSGINTAPRRTRGNTRKGTEMTTAFSSRTTMTELQQRIVEVFTGAAGSSGDIEAGVDAVLTELPDVNPLDVLLALGLAAQRDFHEAHPLERRYAERGIKAVRIDPSLALLLARRTRRQSSAREPDQAPDLH